MDILNETHFLEKLSALPLEAGQKIAVAVSGGVDSMALALAFVKWADFDIHILSVDHGLRKEARSEVELVERYASQWGARFQALKWEHGGVENKLQEQARVARYGLMLDYCEAQGIKYLLLAHHMDDQAETFLFRLCKGSGLDGLASMRTVQEIDGRDVCLVRPLLEVPKEALITFCEEHGIDYVHDPSNESAQYARVRLRQAREVLEAEGLSNKRLAVSAKRFERARSALEYLAHKLYNEAILNKNTKRIVFDFKLLINNPEELILRCVMMAMEALGGVKGYGARFEKIEHLVQGLLNETSFRKRTLGGVVFERDDKNSALIMHREGKN